MIGRSITFDNTKTNLTARMHREVIEINNGDMEITLHRQAHLLENVTQRIRSIRKKMIYKITPKRRDTTG